MWHMPSYPLDTGRALSNILINHIQKGSHPRTTACPSRLITCHPLNQPHPQTTKECMLHGLILHTIDRASSWNLHAFIPEEYMRWKPVPSNLLEKKPDPGMSRYSSDPSSLGPPSWPSLAQLDKVSCRNLRIVRSSLHLKCWLRWT